MKIHFNTVSHTDACKKLDSLIRTLMGRVAKLAPHPSRPHYTGALFISGTESYRPAAEYDAMGGLCMMEAAIGSAFVSDLMDAGDAVSMVISDRSKPIYTQFNAAVKRTRALQAYYSDLPMRLKLESWIASCLRDLYATRSYGVDCRYPVCA